MLRRLAQIWLTLVATFVLVVGGYNFLFDEWFRVSILVSFGVVTIIVITAACMSYFVVEAIDRWQERRDHAAND